MKTIINITLTLAVLLSGFNVYADGDKTKETKTAKVISNIENKFDTELSLESWMTEIKEFAIPEFFVEETLTLESWMTESFVDETSNLVELNLVLEGWMTDYFSFSEQELVMEDWMTKSFDSEDTFKEEALQLEDWMLDLTK
ncbi:MAG: hypothetical protein K9H49_16835 [Bacteroidales bacterium]|nr:hypothetical protein [Bacteroidales bacterium]MCF8406084.1 hypothetical protein [Bacteroidales bacterium]